MAENQIDQIVRERADCGPDAESLPPLILVVTLLASALPTLRAARSSPLDALRTAE